MANLSKIKREKMLDYLEKLKEITGDDENIRAITEIENTLNEKKYEVTPKSLTFWGHFRDSFG